MLTGGTEWTGEGMLTGGTEWIGGRDVDWRDRADWRAESSAVEQSGLEREC